MATEENELPREVEGGFGVEPVRWLSAAVLCVPYIPDFLVDDLLFYFAPSLDGAREAYHSLPPAALDRWSSYFSKKGFRFHQSDPGDRDGEGPYKVRPGALRIELLESGRLFGPRPYLRLPDGAAEVPIVSLEKKRPLNPWKPQYIRALNFIKKYEPPRPIPKEAEYCLWEIEECGEVSGSTSWENAERILLELAEGSDDVQEVLADVFSRRPEDFPLGSEVYLRILGNAGDDGYARLCDLHSHPQRLKRRHVAVVLGKLGNPQGLETLIKLLDDHETDVRDAAICAVGKVGLPPDHTERGRMEALLESNEISHQVWAAEALYRGGDSEQEKRLIAFVKERDMPLYNMGELGHILQEFELVQAVPFLIKRLRSDRVELRDDAAEVLRELTGVDPELTSQGDGEQRRGAIKAWKNWWEDYKRNKRKP